MPVIRFLREGRDVECYPGENLRDVALRENIELYGLKGQLGNCGGCGQCITCFVDVVGSDADAPLTARTVVEDNKLRRRPESWRLACQALVEQSVIVLTRPQVRLAELDRKKAAACAEALPAGPMSWPIEEGADEAEEGSAQENAVDSPATPSDEG
jgi:ferredoxin